MEDRMKKTLLAALLAALLLLPASALGGEYDAQEMEAWLARFCEALAPLKMLGDPQMTADPSRPGEYLLEYSFGTVIATAADAPGVGEILEIDVRTSQVTDARGMRVGMTLDEILAGHRIGRSNTQLYVLGTQEAGLGFSWAYLSGNGVYGVEYITYGGNGAAMKEYTLTYIIDEAGAVSSIRVKAAQASQAQAQQAMNTAEEIALRQRGEVYAVANEKPALMYADLQLMGQPVLGKPVADLVFLLGEPVEIQPLQEGRGRLLLYEGVTVQLALQEQTGEEVVVGVSASGAAVTGPGSVCVGMSVQEAASLFRCDEDTYAVGGILYMEGEAAGEAPYGELRRGEISGEAMLRYMANRPEVGRAAVLEIGVRDGVVTHWYFFDEREDGYAGN